MSRYRKKPVEIEAVCWLGDNIEGVMAFIAEDDRWKEGLDDGYVCSSRSSTWRRHAARESGPRLSGGVAVSDRPEIQP